MKASDIKLSPERQDAKPLPVSREADPPIAAAETKDAPSSVCPWHGGLIKSFPSPGEDGKVFFCPRGGQFWRYKYNDPWRTPFP